MSVCMSSSLYLIYTLKCVYLMHDWLILLQCSDLSHCPVISCHCKIWLGVEKTLFLCRMQYKTSVFPLFLLHMVQKLILFPHDFFNIFKLFTHLFIVHYLDAGLLLPAFCNVCKWTWGGKVTQLLTGTAAKSKKRKLQWTRAQCWTQHSYLYSLFTVLRNGSYWTGDPKCHCPGL